VPAQHGGAFAHPDDAMPAALAEPGTVMRCPPDLSASGGAAIADLYVQGGLAVAQHQPDRRSRRVPHRVAQRLLHDPVGGQVHALREGPGGAGDVDGDRDPAGARRFEQAVQVAEAGLGSGARLVAA
jgi:hypothetical protein